MSGRIFRTFTIGSFAIVPEGDEWSGSEMPIFLGRKGAFGSGEHETTASCLELMESMPLQGARCLDLGSGTGILSIAAGRLGASLVAAVDPDPAAAVSCEQNVVLNGMRDRILTVQGVLDNVTGEFDILLANIYADLHLALADEMVARVKPGGLLLLSGIPVCYNFEVRQRFIGLGCRELGGRMMEDFMTYLMVKETTKEGGSTE